MIVKTPNATISELSFLAIKAMIDSCDNIDKAKVYRMIRAKCLEESQKGN